MLVGVASNENMVAEHFGHCESFGIYEIENSKLVGKEVIENPGHETGFLPRFLHEKGIETIITGGMGKKAIDLFTERSIQVITGASGNMDQAVEAYIAGKLKSTGTVCENHYHAGDCGNH